MATKQNFSGSFVNPVGIGAIFLVVLIANFFEYYALSSFLLFICFLFLLSWLWGKFAMRKVDIQIEALNYNVFPGNRFPVSFTVSNNKLLPLIWIEVLLEMPEKSCIGPDETFDVGTYEDRKGEPPYQVCRRKFTWIMWHQTLHWETHFEAKKRGIYFLDRVSVASGDGFGLTIREKMYELTNSPAFVVYPELIPVDTKPFLRNMHNAASGSKGYYEDVTLLKSNREYQTGDSLKKINWRLLARNDEMQVNVYETILPRSSFFILDMGSFRKTEIDPNTEAVKVSAYEEDLEETLSVLGSLFIALSRQEMGCGLELPQIGEKKGALMAPSWEESRIHELLTSLAGIEFHGEPTYVDEEALFAGRENWGQMYLVCRSVESCTCKRILERLDPAKLTLMVSQRDDTEGQWGNRILEISLLKGGGGQ